MAGNLWGADVEQLRTLAQQFGKVSDTLLQTSSHLTNQINSTPAWKGNDASQFRSQSQNTPFDGRAAKGRARYTIVAGRVAYRA